MHARRSEELRTVSGEFTELESYRYYWEGSDDYSKSAMSIAEIVTRAGQRLALDWSDEWSTVADGILVRRTQGTQQVRILASACPVLVLESSWREYVSWSDREVCSNSSSELAAIYVTAGTTTEAIVRLRTAALGDDRVPEADIVRTRVGYPRGLRAIARRVISLLR